MSDLSFILRTKNFARYSLDMVRRKWQWELGVGGVRGDVDVQRRLISRAESHQDVYRMVQKHYFNEQN